MRTSSRGRRALARIMFALTALATTLAFVRRLGGSHDSPTEPSPKDHQDEAVDDGGRPTHLDTLRAWLPAGGVVVTAVFALLYPYLSAYNGEIGLRIADIGLNPIDLFWRFLMALTYHSRGLPLVLPLFALLLRTVRHRGWRYFWALTGTGAFLLLVPMITPFAPRIFWACAGSVVVLVLLLVAYEAQWPIREKLNASPLGTLALVAAVLWVGATFTGSHLGEQDVRTYLTAPASVDPTRTLMERLAGVSTGRVLQIARAAPESPAAEVDGALVRRFAITDGQLILVDLRSCIIRRVPVGQVALEDIEFDNLSPAVQRAYPSDGCPFPDALVDGGG